MGQRMLRLEVPGKRRRGRPKRNYLFIDVVREDMRAIGVIEQDARDRVNWRKMFCCGDPYNGSSRKKIYFMSYATNN